MRRAILLLLVLVSSSARAEWETVAKGVHYQRIVRGGLDAHVATIDLREQSLRVVATGEDEAGRTVSEFAKDRKAILAVNADYFSKDLRPIGKAIGACGVWWNGAPDVKRHQGLVAVGKGKATIQGRTQKTRWWMRGAVSGWPLLVESCKPIASLPGSDHFTRAPHPRTAVGLSKDGKTMILVVADGRREGVPGPTLPELADLMTELGACRAMNLDGGGSSAMWVRDRIVNRPSDGPERVVGNHLGVIAAADDAGCPKKKDAAR